MGAEVEYSSLVYLIILVVDHRLFAVLSHEILDQATELALTLCDSSELLLVQVAEADQNVHQCRSGHLCLIDQRKHLLSDFNQQRFVLRFLKRF